MNSSFQNSNGATPDLRSRIAAQIDELMQIAVLLQSALIEPRVVDDSNKSPHLLPRGLHTNENSMTRPIDTLVTQLARLNTTLLAAPDHLAPQVVPRNVIEPQCLQCLVEVLLRITYGRAPDAAEVQRFIEKLVSHETALQDVVRLIAEPIVRLLAGSPAQDNAATALTLNPTDSRRFTESDLRQVIANVLLFATGVAPERALVAQRATEITSGRTALAEFMVNELSTDKAVAHLTQLGIVFRSLGMPPTFGAFDARSAAFPMFAGSLSDRVSNAVDSPLRMSNTFADASYQAASVVPNGKSLVRNGISAEHYHQSDTAKPLFPRNIVSSDKQIHFETPRFVSHSLNAMRLMGDKAVVTALGVADRLTDVVSHSVNRVAESTYSPLKHFSDDFRDRLQVGTSAQAAKPPADKLTGEQPRSDVGSNASDLSPSQTPSIASVTQPPVGGQYYSPLVLLPLERNEATLGVPLRDKKNSDEQLLAAATSQIQRLQELLVGRFLFDLPKIEPDTENQAFSDFLLKNGIEYPIKHVRVLNSTDDIDPGNFQSNRLTMVVDGGVKVASASFL